MDVEIEQDDLNQKFLTSLAPEWLTHTIVWRNRSDLDTTCLDELYNHLKVYDPEVQTKSESNSQNMAFISSAKTSSGKEEVEESAPKALMAIDGVGWDWSYMANEEKDHTLVDEQEAPTEFTLMAKSSSDTEVGLGYNAVPPLLLKSTLLSRKMSWTGLPKFADDTIIDYSRSSPSIETNSSDLQNNDFSISENGESSESIMSKPMIKFMKSDSPTVIKTNKDETVRRPFVKYAEMYRKTSKSYNV
nr:ribonuclease H-like domain-containing protein [Tanacetum cinerariifolium]